RIHFHSTLLGRNIGMRTKICVSRPADVRTGMSATSRDAKYGDGDGNSVRIVNVRRGRGANLDVAAYRRGLGGYVRRDIVSNRVFGEGNTYSQAKGGRGHCYGYDRRGKLRLGVISGHFDIAVRSDSARALNICRGAAVDCV